MMDVKIWKYLPDDIWKEIEKWQRWNSYLGLRRIITWKLKFPKVIYRGYIYDAKIRWTNGYEIRWTISNDEITNYHTDCCYRIYLLNRTDLKTNEVFNYLFEVDFDYNIIF